MVICLFNHVHTYVCTLIKKIVCSDKGKEALYTARYKPCFMKTMVIIAKIGIFPISSFHMSGPAESVRLLQFWPDQVFSR